MSTPSTPFYPMTHDDAQELIAAIGDNSKLAEAYDATRTYTVNEHCIHSGKLYRCKTAITTAEGWTAEHWEEITVGEELTENSKGLAKLIPVISGSLNNSGYLISTGDYFEANGELYKATAAIPAGQPWSAYASSVSGSALNEAVSALNSKITPIMYTETTLADIANTLNGLYGSMYCIPFVGYNLTDGSPTGNYIAMRNTNFSNGVRFLYYSAGNNGYIDVTKLNQLSIVNSSGVNKSYVLELYNGNGSTGECEIRFRIGGATGGYYVLNMSTAGLKYGYDDNNGNRNYYKQFT